jgi:hypothetical protein
VKGTNCGQTNEARGELQLGQLLSRTKFEPGNSRMRFRSQYYTALHATHAVFYSVRQKICSPMTSHLGKLTEDMRQEMWRRNKDWWRGSGWVGIGSNEICKNESIWRISDLIYDVYGDISFKITLPNCSITNQTKTKVTQSTQKWRLEKAIAPLTDKKKMWMTSIPSCRDILAYVSPSNITNSLTFGLRSKKNFLTLRNWVHIFPPEGIPTLA